jgi:molecular chaperone GrpE
LHNQGEPMTEETDRRDDDLEGRNEDASAQVGTEGAEAPDAHDVEAEVEELRGELAQLEDRHLRLAAEFDNYRKRNERDRQSLASRLQVDLVTSLLDVMDDLERVAESDEDGAAAPVVEGVRLVEKKFRSIMGAAGLQAVDAEGEVFDPAFMEAMMTVPTEDPSEDDRVADVFQRGYRFGDILVRPARVRVLKYEGPAPGSE